MERIFGIVTDENCYLRSRPGMDAGIEDEIFSGWAVWLLSETKENGWLQVETHYGYRGYVQQSQVMQISREELERRQDRKRFFRIGVRTADLLDRPKVQGLPLEYLLKNAIVERLDAEDPEEVPGVEDKSDEGNDSGTEIGANPVKDKSADGWCRIRTAAGREGYVHEKYLVPRLDDDAYLLDPETQGNQNLEEMLRVDGSAVAESPESESQAAETPSIQRNAAHLDGAIRREGWFRDRFLANPPSEEWLREQVVKSARSYLGVQYRWGGKSSLGLDCSGLVFMSYLENGVLIYRDARIMPEYPVTEITREQLKKGDLIYFPGHVAMYMGEGRYIHSTAHKKTPCVTINSLNPADEDYRDDLAHMITACGSVFPSGQEEEETFSLGGQRISSPKDEAEKAGSEKPDAVGIQNKNPEARKQIWEKLRHRLTEMPGKVSVVYKNLATGESFSYRPDEPHIAASVIKMFLMAAVFEGFKEGWFAPDDRITVRREDCVPSCGVLTYLGEEPSVRIRDLVELMIIVSDNTAANVLFELVGEERLAEFLNGRGNTAPTNRSGAKSDSVNTVNCENSNVSGRTFESLGLEKTDFRRKMFDAERAAQGIENHVTAADVAWLLESIYRGTLVSAEASAEMFRILTHQRLNGKIPFYLHTLPESPVIAHKTGEDDGITHDVAIVMTRESYENWERRAESEKTGSEKADENVDKNEHGDAFILCFLGSETDVPEFERLMAEVALEIYEG